MTRALGAACRAWPGMGASGRARAVLAAALVAIYTLVAFSQSPNPDTWFIIATGREIAAGGVPHENPFAPEGSGWAIVVQQWGYCLLSHLSHDAFGWPGVLAMNYSFYLLFLAALAFAARSFGLDGPAAALDAALPTLALLGFGVTAARPHSLDCAAWLYAIGACERCRRGDARFLAALPAVVALHANMHVSMAPVDVAVVVAYAVKLPARASGRLALDGYARAPFAAVAAAGALALFLTPYGADGAALLLGNAGGSGGIIPECLPSFDPNCQIWGPLSLLASGFVALGLVHASAGSRSVDLPCALMLAGSAALTVSFCRCWELLAVSWVPACAFVAARGGRGDAGRVMTALAGVLCVVFMSGSLVPMAVAGKGLDMWGGNPFTGGATSPSGGVDAVEALGAGPGDLVVTSPLTGGYLEHRGYRVTLDTRYEVWNPASAKSESCTSWPDYVGSVRMEEGAAERFVRSCGEGAGWAVIGYDGASYEMDGGFVRLSRSDGASRTLVGYLDAAPDWERVNGPWEADGPDGLAPFYVFRKAR